MKQIVQNYRSGELALLDVPEPAVKPGGVLVRTAYSLISSGTELMKVTEASMSLVGKARSRPDQVAKVLQSVATNGVAATYRKVANRLDSYTPLGYSLCGEVIAVGEGTPDVAVGDLVACAGNEHALHAEVNWVPRNLFCRIPSTVDPQHAAFGTVGAIAMQGVRRGEPALGDVALVIGLGLIGQLVVQLLAASGVRVLGVDPDPARCELAERHGAQRCAAPGSDTIDTAVAELTGGHGVDQVYLAAGGSSNEPVELAARLARDRGTVVDIGKCSLDLPWNAYYAKELDVRFSRSYGPGRYDPDYELAGRDYPIGYVRWTERRNLECFLDLLARERIDVRPLISQVADFSDAVTTYRRLAGGDLPAIGVLFRYPGQQPPREPVTRAVSLPRGEPNLPPAVTGLVSVGFVGAGNYASSMLLPHLARGGDGVGDVELRRVVTTSALSAANARRKFGFTAAGTDLDELLADPFIDAVFIVTRHSSHAELTCRALAAGKAVFVEKPLAIDQAGLDAVLSTVEETGNDRLQVGFNRRYAPLLRGAKAGFGDRIGPASVRYLVNAGSLEQDSWYSHAGEGSRFTGEGGHFIDTVSWLLDAEPVSVYATGAASRDDMQVVLGYPDGSTAAITYTTGGPARFGKETIELVADGKALRFHDFRKIEGYPKKSWSTSGRRGARRDKGQRAELAAFLAAVRTGAPMPTSLASLATTTVATLAVRTSLASGVPVRLEPR